jgi:hypothetical protein
MDLKDLAPLNLIEIARSSRNHDSRYLAWTSIPDKSIISMDELVFIGKSGENIQLSREVIDELKSRPDITSVHLIDFIGFNKNSQLVSEVWTYLVTKDLLKIKDLVMILQSYPFSFGITTQIKNEAYDLVTKHPALSEIDLRYIAFSEYIPRHIREEAEKRLIQIPNLCEDNLVEFCKHSLSPTRSKIAWLKFVGKEPISYYPLSNIAHNSGDPDIRKLAMEVLNNDYFNEVTRLMAE